ncbi:MAG: hypothetical protein ACO1RA_12165 [Planctomycetaceae bacterium]
MTASQSKTTVGVFLRRVFPRASAYVCSSLVAMAAGQTWAQLPTTQLNGIFPLSAKAGAPVDVVIDGVDLEDVQKLVFSHPGITATAKMTTPNDFEKTPRLVGNQFAVQVAADVPPGAYEVRAEGRFGQSNPRWFIVSSYGELTDAAGNSTSDKSIEVPLGSGLAGRVDANSMDFVKVPLKAGERVLFNLQAARIGSRMNATLILTDPTGKELSRARDTVGDDPVIEFTAPADGIYGLKIFDHVYGQGPAYFYHLDVTAAPLIDFIFPPSGLAGTNQAVTIYGRNLPGGVPADGLKRHGAPLQKLAANITVPGDEASKTQMPALTQLPIRSALLDAIPYQLTSPAGPSNRVPFYVAQAPVTVEQEPNSTPAQAQKLTVPFELAGQYLPAGDVDWVQFDAKKGDTLWIDIYCHRLGLECDPAMSIFRVNKNEKGEEVVADVAQVDDLPERAARIGSDLDSSSDDPSFKLAVPEDGTYRIMVRDQSGTGGNDPAKMYRLAVRPGFEDFRVLATAVTLMPTPQAQVTQLASGVVRKGGNLLVSCKVDRRDGFEGEIQIRAEGLPPGMTSSTAVIAGDTEKASLVISAAENMAAFSGPIKIIAKAAIRGGEVVREARYGQVVWGTPNRQQQPAEFFPESQLMVTVVDKELEPIVTLTGEDKVWETSLGGKLEIPLTVQRRGDFKEPIKLTATDLPDQIKPAEVNLDGNTNQGKLDVLINQQATKPGVYTFFLRGETKLKHVRNAEALVAAEAEQKGVEQAQKELAEQVTKATTAKDAAVKEAQDATNAANTAQQTRDNQANVAKQKAEAAKAAAENLAKATAAAAADAANAALKEAEQKAKAAADAAAAEQKTADEQLATGEKALVDAKANQKAKDDAKVAAEAALKALQDKTTQGNQIKQQVDQRVNTIRQQNQPRDVNFAVPSGAIKLKVVASPIVISAAAAAGPVKQGEKGQVSATLQRLYGFAENVELSVQLPPGVQGIQVANFSVPGNQGEGKMEIVAAANATPGDHMATLTAKGRFNNVEVTTKMPLAIKIEAAPPK